MQYALPLLHNGRCERLKAGVHGAAMGLAALCALYNAAAWLARRQPHSAINAGLYAAVVVWECSHVRHHVRSRPAKPRPSLEQRPAA